MTEPLVDELRRLVADDDGLHAVYQPIVDLFNGEIVAYEALARGPEGSALGDARRAVRRRRGRRHGGRARLGLPGRGSARRARCRGGPRPRAVRERGAPGAGRTRSGALPRPPPAGGRRAPGARRDHGTRPPPRPRRVARAGAEHPLPGLGCRPRRRRRRTRIPGGHAAAAARRHQARHGADPRAHHRRDRRRHEQRAEPGRGDGGARPRRGHRGRRPPATGSRPRCRPRAGLALRSSGAPSGRGVGSGIGVRGRPAPTPARRSPADRDAVRAARAPAGRGSGRFPSDTARDEQSPGAQSHRPRRRPGGRVHVPAQGAVHRSDRGPVPGAGRAGPPSWELWPPTSTSIRRQECEHGPSARITPWSTNGSSVSSPRTSPVLSWRTRSIRPIAPSALPMEGSTSATTSSTSATSPSTSPAGCCWRSSRSRLDPRDDDDARRPHHPPPRPRPRAALSCGRPVSACRRRRADSPTAPPASTAGARTASRPTASTSSTTSAARRPRPRPPRAVRQVLATSAAAGPRDTVRLPDARPRDRAFDLTGATACDAARPGGPRGDPRPPRPRPAPPRRRPRPGLRPSSRSAGRRSAQALHGPVGPRRRRQRLPGRGPVRARHPPAAAPANDVDPGAVGRDVVVARRLRCATASRTSVIITVDPKLVGKPRPASSGARPSRSTSRTSAAGAAPRSAAGTSPAAGPTPVSRANRPADGLALRRRPRVRGLAARRAPSAAAVGGPGAGGVLVEALGEVQALEHELDGAGRRRPGSRRRR